MARQSSRLLRLDQAGHRNSSTDPNAGHGYLWWLNGGGRLASQYAATGLRAAKDQTRKRGRIVPGAPADLHWALGLGNQLIQVDPAKP